MDEKKLVALKFEALVPKGLLLYKSHDHNHQQICTYVKIFSSWGGAAGIWCLFKYKNYTFI